ncbi:glucan endo-1 3-beta-glucosidas [Striga asiatica]|uniref:glucan endo-1,3-beta-D-glucosidase n=1 Tax=Striga asiatica TaxID=4170 RepID=A0A5A7Q2Q2_STRAF|nr:glucan endo-1 3-beta-glucosidas [Striga asiatica]
MNWGISDISQHSSSSIHALKIGINYGQIASNLPSPSRVAHLLSSVNVTRVKLYDADPTVLSAFAGSNVEFIIGLGNEHLQRMSDPAQAQLWVQQYITPHFPSTKISCITVGNEVLTGNNTQLKSFLLPAMQNVNNALQISGLSNYIKVTTAHAFDVLGSSFPPSSGAFREDIAEYLHAILDFHSQTNSPFLINAYPFFAYKDNVGQISLNYVLFGPNDGMIDSGTNLRYDNMLYAQIDAVYNAIRVMGHTDVRVKVSETGWPSRGDPNEVGASVENARLYNGNLVSRMERNEGTPANPSIPIDVFVFALFNENMKPGPLSERNYGLFYPDGSPVYNIGLQGYLPRMDYSGSWGNVVFFLNLVIPLVVLLMCNL